MPTLHLDRQPQHEIDHFIEHHWLNDGPPTHGYERIVRGNNFGQENFFAQSIMRRLEFM